MYGLFLRLLLCAPRLSGYQVVSVSDRKDDEWVQQAVLAALPGIQQMVEADDMIMGMFLGRIFSRMGVWAWSCLDFFG